MATVIGVIDSTDHDSEPDIAYTKGSAVPHKPGWEQLSTKTLSTQELTPPQKMEIAIAELKVRHDDATRKYLKTKDPRIIKDLLRYESSFYEVGRQLQQANVETADLRLISEAFKAMVEIYEHSININNQDQLNSDAERQCAIASTLDYIPEDVLQAMVRSPKDDEGSAVRSSLEQLARISELDDSTIFRPIARAYGVKSSKDLSAIYPPGSEVKNKALEYLRNSPIGLIYEDIRVALEPAPTQGDRIVAANNFSREYLEGLGVGKDLADKAAYAMRGRITIPVGGFDKSHREVVDDRIVDELLSFSEIVQTLGIENIHMLAEKAGIINFNNFTTDQLMTTLGLINGDQKTIDRLRDGDCTVMFFDGTEDWNGSFRRVGKTTLHGSTGKQVVFELSSMAEDAEELSKKVQLLEKYRVKASTLVISAHGRPGTIRIGDGFLSYRHMPDTPLAIPIAQSPTIQRLLERLKPSVATGKATIILDSCSQASTNTARKVSTGMVLARNAGLKQPVNVYASPVPTAMIRSYFPPQLLYDGSDATKFSVGTKGGLPQKEIVSGIPLDESFR